jgi:hypothetical protein
MWVMACMVRAGLSDLSKQEVAIWPGNYGKLITLAPIYEV